MVKFTSVRMILPIAAVQDYHLHQMDMKTEFLNRDLDETVYMEQPEGFIQHGNEDSVCHSEESNLWPYTGSKAVARKGILVSG